MFKVKQLKQQPTPWLQMLLEDERLRGLRGERGEQGEHGLNGSDGLNGVDGRDGLPGIDGLNGKDGLSGKDGKDGIDGRDGQDGEDGRDGKDGVDGVDGKNGQDGIDGKDGAKGKPPKHQIDATKGRIRFERPDGTWGGWVEIKQMVKYVTGGGGNGGANAQERQDIKELQIQMKAAFYGLGTGVIDIELPGITKLTNTTAKVHAGSGYILDVSTPFDPLLTYTTWEEQTFTDSFVSTNLRTWIAIDSTGTVVQFADEITSAEHRDYIQIGVLTHIDGATITNVNLLPHMVVDLAGKVFDACEALSFVNLEGNLYSGASTTLNTMAKTAGKSFACDRNYNTDKSDPNVTQQAAADPIAAVFYAYRDGSGGETISIETSIDTTKYDDGSGTLATISTGYWVTHRIYVSTTSGTTIIAVGQEQHRGRIEALTTIDTESYQAAPGASELLLRGFITFKAGATGFLNNSDVIFTEADKFGNSTTNRAVSNLDLSTPAFKDYPLSSNSIAAGTYYSAGFYQAPAADANLTQAAATISYGTAAVGYGAHPFIVAGGAGTVDTGVVGLRCNFTQIADDGTLTPSVVEVLTTDITTLSTNDYLEAAKCVGPFQLELYVVSGTPTAYSLDLNYGFAKYEDFGNRDFMVTDFEVTGLAGATDTAVDFALLRHGSAGWTYHATAFSPGNGDICRMSTDYGANAKTANNENFAYKRTNINAYVQATGVHGVLIEMITGQNNTVRIANAHIGVVF